MNILKHLCTQLVNTYRLSFEQDTCAIQFLAFMAFLGVYDGHGGRAMVEYLEEGLQWHVAQELRCTDTVSMAT